jgi:hypothetical protein
MFLTRRRHSPEGRNFMVPLPHADRNIRLQLLDSILPRIVQGVWAAS